MYVRASFVIENSVLIPLFTGIIVTLILFGMRWHDELVVDSIKLQVALKLEQENISDKNEKYNVSAQYLYLKRIKFKEK